MLLFVILASVASGCGGSNNASLKATGSGSNSGTTAGNYTITVTGSSGSSQATTTVALTVQ
jgi:trimeric autotransporter adhesin